MKREHKYLLGGALGVMAIAGVAVAGATIAQNMSDTPKQETRIVQTSSPHYAQAPRPVQPPCDDNNIVGTIGGGIAGGVIGAQFGSGSGKTVATTAGALGGAALGNKYIPTRGATCD